LIPIGSAIVSQLVTQANLVALPDNSEFIMIIPFYAALLALLFVGLSVRIVYLRRTLRIGIGDAGNKQTQRAIRVHSNFAEYTPLALFLIYLLEIQGIAHAQPWWIHTLCVCFIIGRCLHAYGMGSVQEKSTLRVAGMALTFSVLIGSAAQLLWIHWPHFN
jgi:uncharacterized protein